MILSTRSSLLTAGNVKKKKKKKKNSKLSSVVFFKALKMSVNDDFKKLTLYNLIFVFFHLYFCMHCNRDVPLTGSNVNHWR